MNTIRLATTADAAAIAAVFNPYVGIATMVLTERVAEDYLPLIIGERSTILVATDAKGTICGYASVKPYSPRGGYVLAAEISIFLAAAATGQGFGQSLYSRLFPVAKQLGYRHLTAKIWGENEGSIRFHQQHGFRLVGRQKEIGFVRGRRVDVVLMERLF